MSQLPSDADGSHGRADGELRRRVGPARSGESDVARSGCVDCMQAPGRGAVRPPIGIAFDGDLGNRIDAMLAVAMLNGFAAKTEARRISLSVSRPSLKSAQLADVVSAFYRGRPVGGPRRRRGRDHRRHDRHAGRRAPRPTTQPALAAMLSKKTADGTPLYTSAITSLVNTAESAHADPESAARPARRQRGDRRSPGPRPGLAGCSGSTARGRRSPRSASSWSSRPDRFRPGRRSPAIKSDVAAARKLFAEWPTPIVAVGSEVGDALPYPGASIEKDFAWSPAHPLVDAYRASQADAVRRAGIRAGGSASCGASRTTATSRCPTRARSRVLDDGRTRFTPGADGRHRYLIVDPAQKARIMSLYTAMVSAPPAPRPGRGRGAQQ